ncbi:MAG: hypothetical protein HWE21_18515 [Cytophagia bacterium]|nr:hypothetical protein [Cytophagia bacterium]
MSFLLKVYKEKYIKDMYENEYLFFNTLDEFRKLDEQGIKRNDPNEGATNIKQLKTLSVKLNDQWYDYSKILREFSAQLFEKPTGYNINVCSLSKLDISDRLEVEFPDERIYDFGDWCLVLYSLDRFVKIFKESCENRGLDFEIREVKYYDKRAFNGELTPFHKSDDHLYQKEVRILIYPAGEEAIKLELPGLKEIAFIGSKEAFKTLRLDYK